MPMIIILATAITTSVVLIRAPTAVGAKHHPWPQRSRYWLPLHRRWSLSPQRRLVSRQSSLTRLWSWIQTPTPRISWIV